MAADGPGQRQLRYRADHTRFPRDHAGHGSVECDGCFRRLAAKEDNPVQARRCKNCKPQETRAVRMRVLRSRQTVQWRNCLKPSQYRCTNHSKLTIKGIISSSLVPKPYRVLQRYSLSICSLYLLDELQRNLLEMRFGCACHSSSV